MIYSGLVSITLRHLNVKQIIALVKETGLKGIEWGGDIHVPHGNICKARQVRDLTLDAGLKVAAYGSYYRIGKSEDEGLSFGSVTETADALGAGIIRVWAGDRNSQDADEDYFKLIVDESRRIADLAADKDIKVVYEFHEGTLTNKSESCKRLLEAVDHPNMFTYWQPIHGAGVELNCQGIDLLMPWIQGFHVFHWWPTYLTRHPLKTGKSHWIQYMKKFDQASKNIFGLLEIVKDDSVENCRADAATLKEFCAEINKK